MQCRNWVSMYYYSILLIVTVKYFKYQYNLVNMICPVKSKISVINDKMKMFYNF